MKIWTAVIYLATEDHVSQTQVMKALHDEQSELGSYVDGLSSATVRHVALEWNIEYGDVEAVDDDIQLNLAVDAWHTKAENELPQDDSESMRPACGHCADQDAHEMALTPLQRKAGA